MTQSLNEDPLLRSVPTVKGYKILPPCVLYSRLDKGGMGAVYLGWHAKLNHPVAIKCLLRKGEESDSSALRRLHRFQREARLAATVSHQNLVRAFELNENHGLHYLLLEFVDGLNIRDVVKERGQLSVQH